MSINDIPPLCKKYGITLESLPRPIPFDPKERYGDQKEFLTSDRTHLIVQYDIEESSMMCYSGFFAVYKVSEDQATSVFLHPWAKCWDREPICIESGRYVIISSYIYDIKTNGLSFPFIILDLKEHKLAYYLMMESFAYNIEEKQGRFILKGRDTGNDFRSHDGKELKLKELIWVPFADYENHRNDYIKGKLGDPYEDCSKK